MKDKLKKSWHALSVDEIFRIVETSPAGLSDKEAAKRLAKYGPNEIAELKKESNIVKFLLQFKSIPILMLLVAALIAYFIGELLDSIVILCVLVANACISYTFELKAERALQLLKKMAAAKASVVRSNEIKNVPANSLVPGDIIMIEEGTRVPADARIIESVYLEVDESALTGESVPVEKGTAILDEKVPRADRTNMVYAGTIVTHGRGKCVVVNTGMSTEVGRIAGVMQKIEKEQTPLQLQLDRLGKQIGKYAVIIGAILVIVSTIYFYPVSIEKLKNIFLMAVCLAVAIIPEGLPIVVLVTLAVGMQQMARRNAIVRKLMCVETLGCTTVICSDKTGTLTKNEMTVCKIYVGDEIYDVTGVGYEPKGDFFKSAAKQNVAENPDILQIVKIGVLCNNAHLLSKEGRWLVIGDPTEGALLTLGRKASLDITKLHKVNPRVDELVFDPARRYMSTVHRIENKRFTCTKGAPEVVLSMCDYIQKSGVVMLLTDIDRKKILAMNEKLAKQRYRVLAFAYSDGEKTIFVGLMGIVDPLRPEAKRAVQICKKAGIRVIMITGDQRETALAVANELRLIGRNEICITGVELDELSEEQFNALANRIAVYARVSPEHKLKVVEYWKKKGEVVAVTGDGINDALALTKADIGVGMGLVGTDIAKEASELVLADDRFSTIVGAVGEGRRIFDNIRKFVGYNISTNIGAVILIFGAVLFALPLPLLPVQLLWINIMMDGPPAVSLGLEAAPEDIMQRKPRKSSEKILSKAVLKRTFTLGTLMGVGAFILFLYLLRIGNIAHASTVVFTTYVVYQMFNVLNYRSENESVFKVGFFKNKFLLIAISVSLLLQICVVYMPVFQTAFHTTPLTMFDWLLVIVVGSSVFVFEEARKAIGKAIAQTKKY